jgi:hypothetical protein
VPEAFSSANPGESAVNEFDERRWREIQNSARIFINEPLIKCNNRSCFNSVFSIPAVPVILYIRSCLFSSLSFYWDKIFRFEVKMSAENGSAAANGGEKRKLDEEGDIAR